MTITVVNKPSHIAGRSGQSRAAWDKWEPRDHTERPGTCRRVICRGRELFDLRPDSNFSSSGVAVVFFYGCGMGFSDLQRLGCQEEAEIIGSFPAC